MSTIADLRCYNHAGREAVARCPQCGRTFCRECITEHDARIVCAQCLASMIEEPARKKTRKAAVLAGLWQLASFIFLWAAFYTLGKILLMLPSDFHKTAFWEKF